MPRVYEKMQEKLLQIGSKSTGLKKAVVTWAKSRALEEHRASMRGDLGGGVAYRLAQRSRSHTTGYSGMYCSEATWPEGTTLPCLPV